MGFMICWLGLGFLFFANRVIHKSFRNGQAVFTGIWFLSLTSIWLFPSLVREAITLPASLLVVAAHFSFFVGNIFAGRPKRRILRPLTDGAISGKGLSVAKNLFWVFTPVALGGCILAVRNSGALSALMDGTLVYIRSLILNKEIIVPLYIRMMSNMIYPAAMLGAVCFIYTRRTILSWTYILLPTFCGILFGLASGGRGGIGMTTPIILLALWATGFNPVRTRRNGLVLLAVTGLIVLFFVGIAATRSDVVESTPDLPDNLVVYYFAGPVPAFSQWLKTKDLQLINCDLREAAPVKELLRPFGFNQERTIDEDVVYVPYRFNIYTHLAEHVLDFGVIGALIVSGFIGYFVGFLDQLNLLPHVVGLRALIYAALAMSIFADMTFFLLGWWIALFVAVLILPLSKRSWAHKPWFSRLARVF